jgi:hypothetical protein
VATIGTFAASLTPAGAAALHSVEGAITSAVTQHRPAVDAFAGGASGSGGGLGPVVMHIGPDARLVSKLIVKVHVSVTCGPFLSQDGSYFQVQLSEVEGRRIANGYNTTSPSLICDGAAHSYGVKVQAENLTWRKGSGQATAATNICGVDTSGFFACQSGSASRAVTIK